MGSGDGAVLVETPVGLFIFDMAAGKFLVALLLFSATEGKRTLRGNARTAAMRVPSSTPSLSMPTVGTIITAVTTATTMTITMRNPHVEPSLVLTLETRGREAMTPTSASLPSLQPDPETMVSGASTRWR